MTLGDREAELEARLDLLYQETAEVNRELREVRAKMVVICPTHQRRMQHSLQWICAQCEPHYWDGLAGR